MCECQSPDCSCHDHLHGYRFHVPTYRGLGALTPEQATEEVFPASQVPHSAGGTGAAARDQILASAQAQEIMGAQGADYVPGSSQCAHAVGSPGISNVQLATIGSGLALTGTSIGLTASGLVTAAALAPWTMGISAIIGLFPILFGHHSQAVRKEQSVLCSAVPAANNYLQLIDQAVKSGKASPQDGIHALDSLLSDFESQVASIRHGTDPMSSGECNAACVEQTKLHAVVLLMQSQYQDLISSAALPAAMNVPVTAPPIPASPVVSPSRPNVVAAPGTPTASSYSSFYSAGAPAAAPSSSPSWLPIAAVAIGAFFLVRGL
jgi:hypothetical protein